MQALSRQSGPQKLVWSGWKEIIRSFISLIRGRNRWQSRRCRVSRFWCIKSRSSLPRISSLSTLRTPELSYIPLASVSLSLSRPLSHFLHPLISLSLSRSKADERLWRTQSSLYTSNPWMCHGWACRAEKWPLTQSNKAMLWSSKMGRAEISWGVSHSSNEALHQTVPTVPICGFAYRSKIKVFSSPSKHTCMTPWLRPFASASPWRHHSSRQATGSPTQASSLGLLSRRPRRLWVPLKMTLFACMCVCVF